ncbi:MAG: FecR domain-containing protein [Desulfobacter sp.]|nr:MAG: FecR domain-containing protein [Desulfobacter sp.]
MLSAAEPGEKSATVVVAQKDNLVNICKVWLEAPNNWPAVARFNRLENPHLIYPGQRIKIPAKLLKGIPMDGAVTFLKGDVWVWPPEAKNRGVLKYGDRVVQGTEIETGKDSAVEITFEDGSSFFLRPDTRISIRTARQRQPYYMIRQLFVPAGRTLMRIKKSTGRDSRFEIHTPSAVSAARGTRFRVSVDEENVTRTEVLDGIVGVKGRGKEVVVDPGQGTWVKKGAAARPPEPLPEPPGLTGVKALYQTQPFTFSLVLPEQAAAGRVVVATDPEMRDVVSETLVQAGEPIPRIMLPDGKYHCRALSVNKAGLEGIASEPRGFEVRVNPLPPFIQAPLDGSRFKTDTVELEWLSVADAVSYEAQVARVPDFSAVYKETTGITGVGLRLEMEGYGPYYFRVRSIAGDGFAGLWSDGVAFTHVQPPKAPEAEAPAVDEDAISLRWQDMGSEMTYDFQMAKDPEFKEILFEQKTTAPAVSFDRPGEGGIYYVRIRAVDPDGYEGEFTPAQTFEIKEFPYLEAGAIMTWIVGALIIIL